MRARGRKVIVRDSTYMYTPFTRGRAVYHHLQRRFGANSHNLVAVTRAVSPSIARCELTHIGMSLKFVITYFPDRVPVDLEQARNQHKQYESALRSLGVEVVALPEVPSLPDSVFVEDCAIVLDECAIITRPGALSRRPETESIAVALAPYRALKYITEPGTVDGGDVLQVGKKIYVGLSSRSNQEAVSQLQEFLGPFGYSVCGVHVGGCLHLKTAVTQVGEKTLLVNPDWVEKTVFGDDVSFIDVDPEEPFAANAVLVDKKVIFPSTFPNTQKRLEDAGIIVVNVPADELAKAEGAVTCCSLIFKKAPKCQE